MRMFFFQVAVRIPALLPKVGRVGARAGAYGAGQHWAGGGVRGGGSILATNFPFPVKDLLKCVSL